MFRRRKTMLYFAPHQDDELLSMGVDICTSVREGHEVHVILCSDGSKSNVRLWLSNHRSCPIHEGTHEYELTVDEFIQARDREFRASCMALGVPERNIHIPDFRDVDGMLQQENAEKIIRRYFSRRRGRTVVCTIGPDNGPEQYSDHQALGRAAEKLMAEGVIPYLRLFVEPYQEISETAGMDSSELKIQEPDGETEKRIRSAIDAYALWEPERGRYAVGYHSVKGQFDAFREQMQCVYYEKYNPEAMLWLDRLIHRHASRKTLPSAVRLPWSRKR